MINFTRKFIAAGLIRVLFTLDQISSLAKTVKDANETTVEKKTRVPKKATGASSTSGGTKPLFDRLLKLSTEKVFDVSAVESKGPSGAKSIDLPKGTNSKKTLIAIRLVDPTNKTPVVKNLVSNNPASLKIALDLIFPGEAGSVDEYLNTWSASVKPAAPAATVVSGSSSSVAPIANGKGLALSPNSIVTMPALHNGVTSPVMSMSQMYTIAK